MVYNNPTLRALANEMIEDLKKQQRFDVGDTMRHEDSRIVKVVRGQYWGEYGLSNHWTFKEVLSMSYIFHLSMFFLKVVFY